MPTKKKMRAVICIDLEIDAESWKHLVSIEDQLEDAADYFLWKPVLQFGYPYPLRYFPA